MFNTPLERLAIGISHAEGWMPAGFYSGDAHGTLSYQNHNPGNLRESIFQVGVRDGFAVFDNDLTGLMGLIYQWYLYATGRNSLVNPNESIAAAIAVYAGLRGAENTPNYQNYVSTVSQWSGLDVNQPVTSLLS